MMHISFQISSVLFINYSNNGDMLLFFHWDIAFKSYMYHNIHTRQAKDIIYSQVSGNLKGIKIFTSFSLVCKIASCMYVKRRSL